jgi:anti-sigma B factor antagonist
MDIQSSSHGEVTLLALSGEIDLHTSPKLREALQGLLKEKTARLLVDLAEVSYMDSSALATLIEYLRDSSSYAGKLALCNLQPRVKVVFELVRLNELFRIFPTREEALAELQAG